jgi:hypothetical protein
VRPLTIGEVEAGFPLRIVKSRIHGDGTRCQVELQQVKPWPALVGRYAAFSSCGKAAIWCKSSIVAISGVSQK